MNLINHSIQRCKRSSTQDKVAFFIKRFPKINMNRKDSDVIIKLFEFCNIYSNAYRKDGDVIIKLFEFYNPYSNI
jgi:hypothetical protein